ncbi:MAG TPA: methyltransferase domain-containing protein, partial [Methylomirabilota bacterium]|nr:methyltransferase domain-containing protein [Methylomirabilota bacterium]
PGASRALDLGCGAGRNTVPIARLGWNVVGVDQSWPMIAAAATRAGEDRLDDPLRLVLAPVAVGFAPDPAVVLREYNRPRSGTLSGGKVPAIYEAAFRKVAG